MYYIEVPKKLTLAEQKMMIELEHDAFSRIGAVDDQTLVSITRYGKMIWYSAEGDLRPIAVAEIMRSMKTLKRHIYLAIMCVLTGRGRGSVDSFYKR